MEDNDAILKVLVQIAVASCDDSDLLNLIYKLLLASKQE